MRDRVSDYLRREIFSGRLRGGDKIDPDAVADVLGVSKLPVREGLLLLESQGLVRNVPRRGAFVQVLSERDIVDHFRALGMLSGLAAERTASSLSNTDRETLLRNVADFSVATDERELARLNFEFHRVVLQAGSSNLLSSILAVLGRTLPNELFYGEEHRDWAAAAVTEHRRILDALIAGDGRAAATAMMEHLEHGGSYAVEQLEVSGALSRRRADK